MIELKATQNRVPERDKWRYPEKWLVIIVENPFEIILNGLFGGTPILGNFHIVTNLKVFVKSFN